MNQNEPVSYMDKSNMRSQTPFPLRMPEDLRATIEDKAKENGRSVNSELLIRLESTIKEEKPVFRDMSLPLSTNMAISELEALKEQIDQAIERLKENGL